MVINFLKKNHSKSLDKKINKIGSKKIFEQQRDLKNDIDEVLNKLSRLSEVIELWFVKASTIPELEEDGKRRLGELVERRKHLEQKLSRLYVESKALNREHLIQERIEESKNKKGLLGILYNTDHEHVTKRYKYRSGWDKAQDEKLLFIEDATKYPEEKADIFAHTLDSAIVEEIERRKQEIRDNF